jgi:PAS domain S-box-containing protein
MWEKFFWMSVDGSLNPVCIFDRERRYVHVNAPAAELAGRSRHELVGTRPDDWVPEMERATIDAHWRDFMRAGERAEERVVLSPDGERMVVRYALTWDSERELAVAVWERVSSATSGPGYRLTPREDEIVAMVARGMTSRAIADELGVSLETVRTHIRNAMAKTGAHTRAGLVAKALAKR